MVRPPPWYPTLAAPLFVALGASLEEAESPETVIEGYFLGLSKRSVQFA